LAHINFCIFESGETNVTTIDIQSDTNQLLPEPFEGEGGLRLPSESYVVASMPGLLGGTDMTAIYIMVIFFISNIPTFVSAGPAGFTYLAIGAITFFLPCVIVTAQLGVMLPHEGSLYNWTHKAFGGYWGFFIGFCAWFPGVLVMIACGDTVVGLINGLNGGWLQDPWQQGLTISAIIVITGFLSTRRFRSVQYVVNLAVYLILFVVLLLLVAMLFYLFKGGHPQTNFSNPSNWGVYFSGARQNINLFGIITLAYLGVEIPMILGGEIIGSGAPSRKTRRVITGHLLWGTVLVFLAYGIGTLAVLVVDGSTNGSVPMSIVLTIGQELGNPMAFVAIVIIMAFFVVDVIVYNMLYSRLLLIAAIDKHLPKSAGKLNRYRIPSNAILFQTIVAIVITLLIFLVVPAFANLHESAVILSFQVYEIMQAAATLVWAISTFCLFICLLHFMNKDRVAFKKQQIFPRWILTLAALLGSFGSIAAIVGTLFFSWLVSYNVSNGQWSLIVGGGTALLLVFAGIGSALASGQASWERMRGEV
jgi:glutamate:GABA antiporter